MKQWFNILIGILMHIVLLAILFYGSLLLGYEKFNSDLPIIFLIVFASACEIVFVGVYLYLIFKDKKI